MEQEQEGAGAAPRVLLVDDDYVDRMAARRHLERAGITGTVEAEGVLEAITKLTAEHFDCVLLDFNLPDGDGLTFLRGMRAAGLAVPVIMLTGQADAAVAADLIEAGAADYIPKGKLTAERLLTSLRAVLE